MGAWGEQPRENDGAGDLFDAVVRPSRSALDKLFNKRTKDSWVRWERLGALQAAMQEAPAIVDYDTLKAARVDLDDCEADVDWIDSWNEPAKIKRAISAFRRVVEKLISKG